MYKNEQADVHTETNISRTAQNHVLMLKCLMRIYTSFPHIHTRHMFNNGPSFIQDTTASQRHAVHLWGLPITKTHPEKMHLNSTASPLCIRFFRLIGKFQREYLDYMGPRHTIEAHVRWFNQQEGMFAMLSDLYTRVGGRPEWPCVTYEDYGDYSNPLLMPYTRVGHSGEPILEVEVFLQEKDRDFCICSIISTVNKKDVILDAMLDRAPLIRSHSPIPLHVIDYEPSIPTVFYRPDVMDGQYSVYSGARREYCIYIAGASYLQVHWLNQQPGIIAMMADQDTVIKGDRVHLWISHDHCITFEQKARQSSVPDPEYEDETDLPVTCFVISTLQKDKVVFNAIKDMPSHNIFLELYDKLLNAIENRKSRNADYVFE